ncbi:MAG: efflux RND transporter periplasmic adaptor subunit [Parabacteroides gordonii]|jgi:HlyD family secretion protein|uniref:efflux RND transporter periplasmic adaptor subunit n=1 Tax=Parabacteroides gordonii TaxID=574930 RepID=UPI00241CAC90|nr:HlyD family efflux transporter periplasmic adaptor subunit [Parabacteroides gordonii]
MDIQLEKKRGIQKKHLPYVAGGVLFLVLVGWIIFGDHASTLKVDARGISIGNAVREQFNDFVRVDGQVQPITVVQLSPEEGGIVQEKVVEEGAQVKKGDVIVRLSNSSLDLQILDAEAQLAEKQNFLRNTQVAMEQDKLSNQLEKAQLDVDMNRARRAYHQQQKLYEESLIAKEDYLKAKEDYELATKKYDLVVQRLYQDSISRTIQMEEMETSLANMRRNIQLVHERKEHLNVRSQINGELGLLDVVLGQNVTAGMKIGQINDLSDYKVEAMIDEHYIDRVKPGLSAAFDRQGTSFALAVRKVYPEVRDGKFRTDFVFTGERPDNIRSGQTYYINLELGQPTESIIIPRGTFFQSTGGSWIFVLDKDGKKAYRRKIKIGRQNPQFYEVIEGLEAGEKVIVSSYESYKDNEVLVLE